MNCVTYIVNLATINFVCVSWYDQRIRYFVVAEVQIFNLVSRFGNDIIGNPPKLCVSQGYSFVLNRRLVQPPQLLHHVGLSFLFWLHFWIFESTDPVGGYRIVSFAPIQLTNYTLLLSSESCLIILFKTTR